MDIRNEKISREYAARKYGVVLVADELRIDAAATASLRVRLRAQRKPAQGNTAGTIKT